MKCPYCNSEVILDIGTAVYNTTKYGFVWVCSRYPECDAYVGCHPRSSSPLGTPANKELRLLRKEAHRVFDKIWGPGKMKRFEAYRELSKEMGVRKSHAHIAMFGKDQCLRVIDLFEKKRIN